MTDYVHGYSARENQRLVDQATTLAELLLADTVYPAGARVLEAGCGVGAQTLTLARQGTGAEIVAVDVFSRIARGRQAQGCGGGFAECDLPARRYLQLAVRACNV